MTQTSAAKEQLARKRRTVALIEYPLLQLRIGEGMRKRGIPFLLETRETRNVLTVRIVKEHFFEIPVSLKNVDKVIGMMQYILLRPDCAKEVLPRGRIVRNCSLARSWNETASSGSV